MPFLKKFGEVLVTTLKIVTGFGPLVGMAYPQAANAIQNIQDELGEAMQVIVSIEAAGQALALPGPQKLIAATPGVTQVFLRSRALMGKKVKDEAKFKAAIAAITSGLAEVLNSLDEDGVKTQS